MTMIQIKATLIIMIMKVTNDNINDNNYENNDDNDNKNANGNDNKADILNVATKEIMIKSDDNNDVIKNI